MSNQDGTRDWLNGYWFWRKEYTARNEKYQDISSKLDGLCHKFSDSIPEHKDGCYFQEIWPGIIEGGKKELLYYKNTLTEGQMNFAVESQGLINDIKHHFDISPWLYPTDPSELIDLLCSGKPTWDDALLNSCNMPPWEFDVGKYIIDFSGKSKTGDLTLKINVNSPLDIMLNQIKKLIIVCREGDIQNYSPENEGEIKKTFSSREGVSYDRTKDASRAVGLWLFDYGQQNGFGQKGGCTRANAAQAFIEFFPQDVRDRLGCGGQSLDIARPLTRWMEKTQKCVEAAEVLKFY